MNNTVVLWGDLCIDHNIINRKRIIGPGGAAFFTAQIFRQLGMQPTIISPRGHDYTDEWLKGISVIPVEKAIGKTLAFENNYDENGNRTLIVHNRDSAHFIDPDLVSAELLRFAHAVTVCPVDNNITLNQIRKLKNKISSTAFLACLPQGFFRTYHENGVVSKQDWYDADLFMPYFDLVCLSEMDGVGLDKQGKQWSTRGPIIVITRAERGCSVFVHGNRRDFPAFHVTTIVDPVGAGDVFAAGFIYSYLRDKDIDKAAVFANAAGALSLQFHATDMQIKHNAIEQMMVS